MTGEGCLQERRQRTNGRQASYPWLLWAVCVASVAAALVLRWAIAGRIWGVRTDPIPFSTDAVSTDTVMGFGPVFLGYALGLAAGAAGLAALIPSLRQRPCRHMAIVASLMMIALWVVPFMGLRSVFSGAAAGEIAARSRPLIAALTQYGADHGEYPDTLAELVPDYLDSVPGTGYGAYRRFRYFRARRNDLPEAGQPNAEWARGFWVGASPYALVVYRVPSGTMVYRPTGDYGDIPGWRPVPRTDWADTSLD